MIGGGEVVRLTREGGGLDLVAAVHHPKWLKRGSTVVVRAESGQLVDIGPVGVDQLPAKDP